MGLTPADDVLLVHAVPRPIEAPRATVLVPVRARAEVDVVLFGGVDVHGPSTDSLVADATWEDVDDAITLDRLQRRPMAAVAFQSPIEPDEDIAVLWGDPDGPVAVPGVPGLRAHQARHRFGDTRHRVVTYRFRATTRFREYFHPSLLAPTHDGDDGRSVVSPAVEVDVPSSAPPAAPVVHSVIPLFRWDVGEEPEQPLARRHVRRAGVRIYLERPWFSSGDGELLAVLLAPGGGDDFEPQGDGEQGFPFVSKAGQDPVWVSAPVAQRAMNALQLDDLVHLAGLDDDQEPGRPVTPPALLPLDTIRGRPTVQAVGYRPQYSEDRGLWYVDVALDAGVTTWAFVRLAVARYQPSSVDGCHLSAPVRCDYVQLPPERTVSVSRTDESHVRVVVSGTVAVRSLPVTTGPTPPVVALVDRIDATRTVVARLQRRDPLLPTDLGWETVTVERLRIRGTGSSIAEAAWVGELDAGRDVDLRRPRDPDVVDGEDPPTGDWRIMVEEWERLPGDVLAPREAGPLGRNRPLVEQRLVFADEVLL